MHEGPSALAASLVDEAARVGDAARKHEEDSSVLLTLRMVRFYTEDEKRGRAGNV